MPHHQQHVLTISFRRNDLKRSRRGVHHGGTNKQTEEWDNNENTQWSSVNMEAVTNSPKHREIYVTGEYEQGTAQRTLTVHIYEYISAFCC